MATTTKKKAAAPKGKAAAQPVTTDVTTEDGEATPASGSEAVAKPKAAAKAAAVAKPKAAAKPKAVAKPTAAAKSKVTALPESKDADAPKVAAASKSAAKPKAKAATKARVSSKVEEAGAELPETSSPGVADTLVAEMLAESPAAEVESEPVVAKGKPRAAAKKKAAAASVEAASAVAAEAAVAAPVERPLFPDTGYAVVEKLLVGFIASEVRKVGLTRAVLGLSGGVDSAVSAAIAARALGPSNVLGIFMPYQSSSPESRADADEVAAALGIEMMVVDITSQVDSYFERFEDASRLRRGNKMARERMTILYDHSAARSALVIGTSNKTELLLGYGTLYGDMASALNPIGDLYKSQVWGLARHLGLPASVIEKAPTADLWSGQTDENELGFSYHEVDRLLYRMIDERCSVAELEDMGFEAVFVERISRMVRSSQFKRRLPVIAKLSARSIDTDFRYSRDWGL